MVGWTEKICQERGIVSKPYSKQVRFAIRSIVAVIGAYHTISITRVHSERGRKRERVREREKERGREGYISKYIPVKRRHF